MTEPTVEARKAAFAAWAESDYGGYESVQAAVDAVWPIAEATVRAKVAAEIRAWAAQIAVRAEVLAGAPTGAADEHPVTMGFEMAARIAEGNGDETPDM